MRIELQSSVLHRDLPGGQVEAAEIGTTPGSMNDEIAGDLQVRRSLARGTHLQAVPVPLDPCDRGAGLDANAERREPRCEPAHQVGIEMRQQPASALQIGRASCRERGCQYV